MARVEIHKEIDTEGEELLIRYMKKFLNEIKLSIKEKPCSSEHLIYMIDKEMIMLDKFLNKLEKGGI